MLPRMEECLDKDKGRAEADWLGLVQGDSEQAPLFRRVLRDDVLRNLGTADLNWRPNGGGRCLVSAAAFAEPDQSTSKLVIFRWFKRADELPFFMAGVWREWSADHGAIKAPDVDNARRQLRTFLWVRRPTDAIYCASGVREQAAQASLQAGSA